MPCSRFASRSVVASCVLSQKSVKSWGSPLMWRGWNIVCDARRLERASFRAVMLVLATVVALGWLSGTTSSAGESWQSSITIDKSFDHSTTAFPLTGKHTAVTCESCHYNAVFKGLGRACNDCHNGRPSPGGEKVSSKPADHIPAANTCNDCHSTATWKTVHVDHRNLGETCGTCHNGKSATGKPTGHVPTDANCKGCHNTSVWVPVRMDHSDMAGPCGLCHDGRRAIGKPVNHIKTSAKCDTCHAVSAWKPAGFAHHGISGNCASCHNGIQALGKVAGHTPTNLPCETCHASTLSFAGTAMNHVGISSACASCHTGAKFQGKGKPASHFQTSLPCETCHKNFVTFSGTKMDHQGISDGCARCHTGLPFQGRGKIAGHFPTSEPCETCHSGFVTFSGTYMNHHGITDGCARCHTGLKYQGTGKSGRHIPTNEPCELCHSSFMQFTGHYDAGASMNHEGITSGCARCHNDQKYQGIGKRPSTATGLPHPVTSLPCEHCHFFFFSFKNAEIVAKLVHTAPPAAAARVAVKFTHTGAIGPCANCHNGSKSTGKPKTHFVTARACDTCHATAAWVPIRFRHTSANYPNGHAATLACRTCHTTNADRVPYSTPGLKPSCAACHSAKFKPTPHPKVRKPVPQYYSAFELKDCAGACHVYADGTGHSIVERRASHHRAGSGGF
jgi:Cytochrome c3